MCSPFYFYFFYFSSILRTPCPSLIFTFPGKPKIQIKKILHPGEVIPVTCDVEYDVPNDLSEEEKADRVPKLSAQIGDVEQTGTISTAFKRVIMVRTSAGIS